VAAETTAGSGAGDEFVVDELELIASVGGRQRPLEPAHREHLFPKPSHLGSR